MEPPPSQITVLGWTDVAAIGFLGSPFERALFDVRVFNPYAPSNLQPLIAKARPTMLAFRLVINAYISIPRELIMHDQSFPNINFITILCIQPAHALNGA